MRHSIIPLFIPHYGCPYRCVFCNQVRITGVETPVTASDVAAQIDRYLEICKEPRDWEAAFYGGSFTALPLSVMDELLTPAYEALAAGRISAIRLSTRPDCIDRERLLLLKARGVQTVELGVQSLDDDVLSAAGRGHTASDVAAAVSLLREYGFTVGLQFMQGLPGETMASLRRTARMGARLLPDFIRLYPVLVLQDTALCRMYEAGAYRPLTLLEAVFRCAFLKRYYARHWISVIRTGLQATEEFDSGESLIAGPYHPAMGELCDQYIARHELVRAVRSLLPASEIRILCAPRDRSKIMGHRRSTWKYLETETGAALSIEETADVPVGTVRIFADGRETSCDIGAGRR